RKQRRLAPINPLNEAPHPIPPQMASESYRANQITKCVFTQSRSIASNHIVCDVRYSPNCNRDAAVPRSVEKCQEATYAVQQVSSAFGSSYCHHRVGAP